MQLCRSIYSLIVAFLMLVPPALCQEISPTADGPKLRGLAEFQQVLIKANSIGSKLFTNCRPTNFRLVEVEVFNQLSTPILVDGDQAQAAASTLTLHQATPKELIAGSGCDPSAFSKALVATATLASAGLAGPIASEMAKKRETLGVPCGEDEVRLSVEEVRLGKRILMPGDKTTGLLCFFMPATLEVPDSLDVKITIPVVTKAPDQVSGAVEVQTSLLK